MGFRPGHNTLPSASSTVSTSGLRETPGAMAVASTFENIQREEKIKTGRKIKMGSNCSLQLFRY